MIDGKRILVMIQARSGSTSVKDKNIADVGGKPVLWYSVTEALKSRYADAVCVSTDSPKYAKIAEDAGVKVPFLRPPELARKDTTAAESSRWSTLEYEKHSGVKYDYIVEFMCTNPLKTVEDLDACIEKLHATGADSVVGVARLWDHHPQRIKQIKDDEIQDWDGVPEILESLRQDLKPAAYIRCGSVYALKRSTIIDEKNRRGKVSRPHIMPPERVANIDEPQDLALVRYMLEARKNGGGVSLGFKILVTANLDGVPEVLETLKSCGEVDYRPDIPLSELPAAAHRYDALFVSTQLMIGESVLKKPADSRLKIVCTASTGRDHLDLEAARRHGIEVLSITMDFDTLKTITSTAENAFNLMLNCARKTIPAFEHVRQGGWDYTKFIGLELNGKTAGIVGFGRLGTIFARFCKAFNMRVLAYDPHVVIHDPDVTQVKDLQRLLAESDFVSLHMHLDASTRRMIGAAQLAAMKPSAYLINTARGGVIDQAALIDALERGVIAGAGIDVIEGEIEGELTPEVKASKARVLAYARAHDNLLITPHISGMSDGGRRKGFGLAARKLYERLSALKAGR
jgi:phosphoglycerate dehydrogenase-like enzyme/CMP-N-acetylneuraminic acid synthetase